KLLIPLDRYGGGVDISSGFSMTRSADKKGSLAAAFLDSPWKRFTWQSAAYAPAASSARPEPPWRPAVCPRPCAAGKDSCRRKPAPLAGRPRRRPWALTWAEWQPPWSLACLPGWLGWHQRWKPASAWCPER